MEDNKPIKRIDMSQIEDGQSIFRGNLLDKDGKIIGPIPTREYLSLEKYSSEIRAVPEEDEFKTMLWVDIDALEFSENRWLVKDLVPKGGSVVIASVSGDGKSWIAMELAKSISTGKNFLDEERFKTVQAKVLYIDIENPQREIQRRGRQLSFSQNDQMEFLTKGHLNLNDDDRVEELIAVIEEKGIKVVIVDTFRAVSGGLKEEKAEEVRTFFNRFMELKHSEISLIWLDHFHKPSQFQSRIPKKEFLFGSQDKTANVEILLMLSKDGDDIFVYQRKNRLDKEIHEFKISLLDDVSEDGTKHTSLVYGGEIDERESKKESAKQFIQEILKDGPMTTPEMIVLLRKEIRVAEKNTREALKELLTEKTIDRRKNGRKDEYFLINNSDNDDKSLDDF